jgi:hypothetical protein
MASDASKCHMKCTFQIMETEMKVYTKKEAVESSTGHPKLW